MPLPKITQDRIEADAKRKGETHQFHPLDGDYTSYKFHGFIVQQSYIAGATAENSRAQVLVDALEEIKAILKRSPGDACYGTLSMQLQKATEVVNKKLSEWNEGKGEQKFCTCSLQHLAAHGECHKCPGRHTRHEVTNPTK